jgi:hypothetical protein
MVIFGDPVGSNETQSTDRMTEPVRTTHLARPPYTTPNILELYWDLVVGLPETLVRNGRGWSEFTGSCF